MHYSLPLSSSQTPLPNPSFHSLSKCNTLDKQNATLSSAFLLGMLISYKRLPARIQPSLYNQARTIGGKSVIITRTEKEVVKMNMNPIRENCKGKDPV